MLIAVWGCHVTQLQHFLSRCLVNLYKEMDPNAGLTTIVSKPTFVGHFTQMPLVLAFHYSPHQYTQTLDST